MREMTRMELDYVDLILVKPFVLLISRHHAERLRRQLSISTRLAPSASRCCLADPHLHYGFGLSDEFRPYNWDIFRSISDRCHEKLHNIGDLDIYTPRCTSPSYQGYHKNEYINIHERDVSSPEGSSGLLGLLGLFKTSFSG